MSDSDPDDEFETYLKQRAPIDKGMRSLESLEPPPELDRIVIGKARKAIQGASPIHMYRAPKWALPVGLAATILLSFAILLDLGVRAKRHDASLQAARTQTSASSQSLAPMSSEPKPVTPSSAARQSDTGSAAGASTAASAASAPEAQAHETEEFTSDRARTRLARVEKATRRARPEPQSPAAETTLQEAVVVGKPSTNNVALSAAPIAAAPADVAPALPAPPLPNLESSGSAAQAPAETLASKASPAPPATWLTRIEKLRNEGHTAEAEREMKRFREAYPDYPIPKTEP